MKFNSKRWIARLLIFTWIAGCGGGDKTNPTAPTQPPAIATMSLPEVAIDKTSLTVQYGKYSEVAVALNPKVEGNIEWSLIDNSLPQGLQLSGTTGNEIIIFGTPYFSGMWCSTLNAKLPNEKEAYKEICFFAQENDALTYPHFVTDRYLTSAVVGSAYQTNVELDSTSANIEMVDGTLPPGIEISFSSQYAIFNGTPTQSGTYLSALRSTDSQGKENSRQFMLVVAETAEPEPVPVVSPEPIPEPPAPVPPIQHSEVTCPPGYYYDSSLQYCLAPVSCGQGTYYEPSLEQCVAYAPPPPTIVCPPQTYFDHFLGECVALGCPQCPAGWHFDSNYNRCIRNQNSCPAGYRWNWKQGQCEYIWKENFCPNGSYWNPTIKSCVSNHFGCSEGSYWNPKNKQCSLPPKSCGFNAHWDPSTQQCVSNAPNCKPGYHLDPSSGQCVQNNLPQSCAPGTHWEPIQKKCEIGRAHV